MRAPWRWALLSARRRVLALLLVGVIIAASGAVTLSAVAGARRAASTFDRGLAAALAPHAGVSVGFDPALWTPDVLEPLRELDGIESWTEAVAFSMRPVGTDFYMLYDGWAFGAVDDQFGTELNKFRIIEGRSFDHTRVDEAVVTTDYANELGLRVGDALRLESWTSDTMVTAIFDQNFASPPPDGPTVEVTVVGIAEEFGALLQPDGPGTVYLTASFTSQWSDRIGTGPPVGLVRLEDGQHGYSSFASAVQSASEMTGTALGTGPVTAEVAGVGGAIDAQVFALKVFAAVAAAAALVVTMVVVSRQLAFARTDQFTLRALGMTRSRRVAAATLHMLPSALVASVGCAILAWLASGFFPVATPAKLEPSPGRQVDLAVLSLGAAAVGLAVLCAGVVAGVAVTRAGWPSPPTASHGLAGIVAGWFKSSVPLSLGVRTALDRGTEQTRVPTRSTLVGCVVGVAGVVAALGYGTSLDHLAATPRLYGAEADAFIAANGTTGDWVTLTDQLEARPEVDQLATMIGTDLVVNGEVTAALVVDPRRGDPIDAIVSGRTPQAKDEMVIGTQVADRLGVGVGEIVAVGLSDGSTKPFTVVGIGAHPTAGGGYREQVTVLGDSRDGFASPDEGPWYGVAVTLNDGADQTALIDSLRRDHEGLVVAGREMPPAVANLQEVDVFPLVLAVTLGTLAVVILLHALATFSRRRAHDLAVLKALGGTRPQLRGMVVTQTATVTLVSLAIGIPIGLAIGRLAWSTQARSLGVVTEHISSPDIFVWVVPTLVLLPLLALTVTRTALSARPAPTLRSSRGD